MGYKDDFNKDNYDNVRLNVSPQDKARLDALAKRRGVSLAALLREAVEDVYNIDLHTKRGAGR